MLFGVVTYFFTFDFEAFIDFNLMADDNLESVCRIIFILSRTSLRGCRCAFWGFVTYFLTFDFEAIIDLN